MTTYFHDMESIRYRLGDNHSAVIRVLAEHYIGNNPPVPYTFRAFNKAGILQKEDGLYDLDFKKRFPDAPSGWIAYAYGLVWSDTERSISLAARCLGPVRLLLNGEVIYQSGAVDEVSTERQVSVEARFRKGWNSLFVRVKNTAAGFGCLLGAEEAKVRILNVLSPFSSRLGQAGWVYSVPVPADLYTGEPVPDFERDERASGLRWLPEMSWNDEMLAKHPFERLFGIRPDFKGYAWSKLRSDESLDCVSLSGYADGPIRIWADGEEVISLRSAGPFEAELTPRVGGYNVLVEAVCGGDSWRWSLEASAGGLDSCTWELPYQIHGCEGPWLYLGPIAADREYPIETLQSLQRVYRAEDGDGDEVYWQTDLPETRIRPYYENALLSNKWTTSGVTNFARWDYPLGVTMYGLLQAGRTLNRPDFTAYALEHIRACTDYYDYAGWDRDQYGFPSVNHQLVLIRMLDNCGSFGSSMLQAYKESNDERFLEVAGEIAGFIRGKLERRPDGAFYRICAGEYSENSMWADDLYMSTPFMRRYYECTGDRTFLDDAVKQFLLYKRYLFMPGEKIMSHVYDFKYGTATGIPWGRGNGWCAFSLSELLEAIPGDHPDRSELLAFFNELCSGYLPLQGEGGLWRQVLNDPEAYEESSCTAMFIYAFCRGVYQGWLTDREAYVAAALKGWRGLTRKAIDRHGNVHGVCSGSRYAFTPDYYNDELRTVTNDNHGIGIVMLAGVEVCRMIERLSTGKMYPVCSI